MTTEQKDGIMPDKAKGSLNFTGDYPKDLKTLNDHYGFSLVPKLVMQGDSVFHGIDVIKKKSIILN